MHTLSDVKLTTRYLYFLLQKSTSFWTECKIDTELVDMFLYLPSKTCIALSSVFGIFLGHFYVFVKMLYRRVPISNGEDIFFVTIHFWKFRIRKKNKLEIAQYFIICNCTAWFVHFMKCFILRYAVWCIMNRV